MFNSILIANRGEIACRVMHTAQSMGVRCIAVYSEVDRNALHVAMSDIAVPIGGKAARESYLQADRIVSAALANGAEAIHPGYGFLSENPEFAEAVEAAGLTFIGPPAEALHVMGKKDAAKRLMSQAGVPVVPGYHGSEQDPDCLYQEAKRLGFPVLIKAVAGGGGRGLRKVEAPEDFIDALKSSKNEAIAAFGVGDVIIEKLIQKPRHIELQIFGDDEQVVHLFERDCSLQRRHQKVIEEAPAPDMPSEVRKAMSDAAVQAAQAIKYKGAGTVEFIADASKRLRPDGFWFMEMNTRLQVEHPVTEEITGIDLVEWQLRVAAGEKLPLSQADIGIYGHAIEARLYAENPETGFLPATGKIRRLSFPSEARSDSGLQNGDTVSSWYDPMIAKIICHGATRKIARERLKQALTQTQVYGCVTNLGFLAALVDHQDFITGNVHTGLIEENLDGLVVKTTPAPETVAWAAMVALGIQENSDNAGFTLWKGLKQTVQLQHADDFFSVSVEFEGRDQMRLNISDHQVFAERLAGIWRLNDKTVPNAVRHDSEVYVASQYGVIFSVIDPLAQATDLVANEGILTAPMPGQIQEICVTIGQEATKGQRLAILGAMKMEHSLLAARDGRIAEIYVTVGQQVELGDSLIDLKAEEASA
ncbi:MAG: acetyl/propionyl/methylcrotonyl-CoA carboxylase subunit alpha [Aestuariivita sp.]|nr:acetyl/propionyl/methylcrotonyl-CoA carboxylase subunit alpha [Aestuariivita sp.]MCY4201724.1 acetyl/propionyl/methylcrotonyl-CoA carboxylase subunit alpha [Aestuariivita sp.]